MHVMTYVVRRPGSDMYYVRVTVPKALRAALKKREVWKSLRTADLREATNLAPGVLATIRAEFDMCRRRKQPTPDDIARAVRDFSVREVQIDLDRRKNFLTSGGYEKELRRIHQECKDDASHLHNSTATRIACSRMTA